jgi:hypothetical protein
MPVRPQTITPLSIDTAEEANKVFGGAADTVELTQHRTEYLCTCGCPS